MGTPGQAQRVHSARGRPPVAPSWAQTASPTSAPSSAPRPSSGPSKLRLEILLELTKANRLKQKDLVAIFGPRASFPGC